MGGRLGAFLLQWEVVSPSHIILGIVRRGYRLEFTRPPPRRLLVTQLLRLAGKEVPVGMKAHSTRAMVASQAERARATPEQICKAAMWSSFATFIKHYRMDLVLANEQAFGRKVLQGVVPP